MKEEEKQVQPLLAGKSSFERILLGVSSANFSGRATTCKRPTTRSSNRTFLSGAPVQVPTGRWRQRGRRPVWLVTVAIYFIAQRGMHFFLPIPRNFLLGARAPLLNSSHRIRCRFGSLGIVVILMSNCFFFLNIY